jgi:hypothetical protein
MVLIIPSDGGEEVTELSLIKMSSLDALGFVT